MARIFVMSNDMVTRVEITQHPDTDAHQAECHNCYHPNLVADTHEQWSLEDTIQVAEIHADRCTGSGAA